jgi:hypothetical protein
MSVWISATSEISPTYIARKKPSRTSEMPHSTMLMGERCDTHFKTRNFFSATSTCMPRQIISKRKCFLTYLTRIKVFFVAYLCQFCPLFTKKFLGIHAMSSFSSSCIYFNTLKQRETESGPVVEWDPELHLQHYSCYLDYSWTRKKQGGKVSQRRPEV